MHPHSQHIYNSVHPYPSHCQIQYYTFTWKYSTDENGNKIPISRKKGEKLTLLKNKEGKNERGCIYKKGDYIYSFKPSEILASESIKNGIV